MIGRQGVFCCLLAVPAIVWGVHILVLAPHLGTLAGDAKFITATQFFSASAALMIAGAVVSILCWHRWRQRCWLIPFRANLTWVYYIKVLFLGPTFGDL